MGQKNGAETHPADRRWRMAGVILCLSLVVVMSVGVGVIIDRVPWGVAVFSILAAGFLTVKLIGWALRLWPDIGPVDGPFLRSAASVFSVIGRFVEMARDNAELETKFGCMLRAYRLVDAGDNAKATALVRRSRTEGKLDSPSARELAQRLVDDPEVKLDFPDSVPPPLQPVCLEMLYRELHDPGKPLWIDYRETADRKELASGLADLLIRRPRFAGHKEEIELVLLRQTNFDRDAITEVLRKAPKVVVHNMAEVVSEYRLGSLKARDQKEILLDLARSAQSDIVPDCARSFAQCLDAKSGESAPKSKAHLLELLYYDRYRQTARRLWPRHQEELIEALTRDLADGPLAGRQVVFASNHRKSGHWVRRILEALKDFDLSLADDVGARIVALRTLAESYAKYLAKNGVSAQVSLADVFNSVKLPATRIDRKFEARQVEIDLLLKLGRQWAGPFVPEAADEERALACVWAGSYLTRDRLPSGFAARAMTSDLALHAGLAEDKERVAEILLALMWRHESQGGKGSVPLRELAESEAESEATGTPPAIQRRWQIWRDEAKGKQGARLTTELLKAIRAQLRSGVWPTKIPLEQMLVGLTDRVEVMARSGVKAQVALEDIQSEVKKVRKNWGNQIDERMDWFVTQIQKAQNSEALERSLGDLRTERNQIDERMDWFVTQIEETQNSDALENLASGLKGLTETDQDLAERIGRLTEEDHRLVGEIGALKANERDLARELKEMLEQDLVTSRRFLITFDSKTKPMAKLIDSLKGKYRLHPDTPYARSGSVPHGTEFDVFYDRLKGDLAALQVDLQKAEATVQLIAIPK